MASVSAAHSSNTLAMHVEAAKNAQAHQDCRTAALEYGQAVRIMPASGELRSNMGVALYCDDQIQEAGAAFKKAIALNPTLFAPHLFLGLAAFHQQDDISAARELKAAVRLNPSDLTAHLWLGYTYVAQHQYEPALEQFQRASRLDSSNMDAYYALGQCYLEIGRKKAQALETLEPGGQRILDLAAEQYRLTGEPARASAAAQASADVSAEKTRSSNPERDKQAALFYAEAKQAEVNARQAFETILQQAPDSYRAHQIKGDAFVAMQQNDSAIAEYRSVLQLNATLPGIHEAMSNCLMQGGHFAEALLELQAEQKLQPRSSRIMMELGRVQLAMSDDSAAIVSFKNALALTDPPAETYLLLGKATLHQGDVKQAIHDLQQYQAENPDVPDSYYLLARAYRLVGDQEAMSRALERYQRISRNNQERQLVQPVTHDPQSVLSVLNAQDVQDADALVSAHPREHDK